MEVGAAVKVSMDVVHVVAGAGGFSTDDGEGGIDGDVGPGGLVPVVATSSRRSSEGVVFSRDDSIGYIRPAQQVFDEKPNLQLIWDEDGESDVERDRTLLELEQECLEVYRRKVDNANRSRAQLRQAIVDSEAELTVICSAMGERPVHIRQPTQNAGNLKEELKAIVPQLEEMRKRKSDRHNQILEVIEQINKITIEIRPTDRTNTIDVGESDLFLRRLEELHRQLKSLQKEKNDRLKQVMDYSNTINSVCAVLGMDFKQTISEIHPTLNDNDVSRNISNDTINRLASSIQKLREIKLQRMQLLQDLATTILELWNLMDTPVEEQQLFQNVTCNVAASEQDITRPNTLSLDFIDYVRKEVLRLEELKVSKMKELVLKKKTELEELRRQTHLVAETDKETELLLDAIETGAVDSCLVLEQIVVQISSIKEEAFSRKEILERVEKWLVACEEESWLEEYNRDENRYSAGRGAHLTLKRAEKTRAMVSKIPAMVDALAVKIGAWESERGIEFTYDGARLLSMVEEYNIVRQEKEEECKRQRDQKKLWGQLIAEQEVRFGSKPSPMKPQSAKKVPRTSLGGSNRRLSLGNGNIMQASKPDPPSSVKSTHSTKKGDERAGISPCNQAKKVLYKAASIHEPETPRKPFTPLAAADSIPGTPTQTILTDAERLTRTPIPYPRTPSTGCALMQIATTHAPAYAVREAEATLSPEVEYSFEERRLECMKNQS